MNLLFPPSCPLPHLPLSFPYPLIILPFFCPSQVTTILDNPHLFDDCPDSRFRGKSLRQHMEDDEFSFYAGSTGESLTKEYLRWLITQGPVPVDFAELLQAQAENLAAGSCCSAFALFLCGASALVGLYFYLLSSVFLELCADLNIGGHTTTGLPPYPTNLTRVAGTKARNNPVLLAPDGKTIMREFANATLGLKGIIVFSSIHLQDVTSIEWLVRVE